MKSFVIQDWPLVVAALVILSAAVYTWYLKSIPPNINNDVDEINEGPIILPQTNYTSDPALTGEEDFIAYVCNYAKKENIPHIEKDVVNFTMKRFEQIRLGYVMDTNKVLFLNDVPKTIEAIVKKYVNEKNK